MNEDWYSLVPANEPLMQGDLILDCPLVMWAPGPEHGEYTADALQEEVQAVNADLIVMTQACDLAEGNVDRVVVCVNHPIEEFYQNWKEQRAEENKGASKNEFRNLAEQIRKGFKWNLHLVNDGQVGDLTTPQRIVDFHDVHTIPRSFLEQFLTAKATSRLRLAPPYREHLSQSFARFFMRVGLPTDIKEVWLPQPQR